MVSYTLRLKTLDLYFNLLLRILIGINNYITILEQAIATRN